MKSTFYIMFYVMCLQHASCSLLAQCTNVTDIDGNVYHTIKIGKQCWMQENFRATHFRDGSPITETEDKAAWEKADQLHTSGWCYFEGNTENNSVYGKLYNWYTVSDPRHLCPSGWHIPSDDEFQTLSDYLGGDSISGAHMKATALWSHPNTGADNSSGFTALPAGYRISSGYFSLLGHNAFFWSSTPDDKEGAYLRNLCFNYSPALRLNDFAGDGFSVRCVGD